MNVYILRDSLDRPTLFRQLRDDGWRLEQDFPFRIHRPRSWNFKREEQTFRYGENFGLGVRWLETEALPDVLADHCQSRAQLLEQLVAGVAAEPLLAAIHGLRLLFGQQDDSDAINKLQALLDDERPAIQLAIVHALHAHEDSSTLLAEVVERFAEDDVPHRAAKLILGNVSQAEQGLDLRDLQDDDNADRLRSKMEAAHAAGHHLRVAFAASKLLAVDYYAVKHELWIRRGGAQLQLDEPWQALPDLIAASHKVASDLSYAHHMIEEGDEDDQQRYSQRKTELTEWQAQLDALLPQARAAAGETDKPLQVEALQDLMKRLGEDYERPIQYAIVDALLSYSHADETRRSLRHLKALASENTIEADADSSWLDEEIAAQPDSLVLRGARVFAFKERAQKATAADDYFTCYDRLEKLSDFDEGLYDLADAYGLIIHGGKTVAREQFYAFRELKDASGVTRAGARWAKMVNDRETWTSYGCGLTGVLAHEAAIEAYGEAMDRGYRDGEEEELGLPYFNRACERAKIGRTRGALADLAEAIRLDDSYAGKAKTDDYFDSVRDDERFAAIVSGDLDKAPRQPPEPGKDVEQHRKQCLLHGGRGAWAPAVMAGHQAVELAEQTAPDSASHAHALSALGWAQIYHAESDDAVRTLQRSVAMFEGLSPEQRDAEHHGEALHQLGAAHHAEERWQEAEQHYLKAMHCYESASPKHASLIKSYGDLGRLYSSQEQFERAIEWNERAYALGQELLAELPESDDERFGIEYDLMLMCCNLQKIYREDGKPTLSLQAAGKALDILESAPFSDQARERWARQIARNAGAGGVTDETADLFEQVAARVMKLADVDMSAAAMQRAQLWRDIAAPLFELQAKGWDDAKLAELLTAIVKGQPAPSEVQHNAALMRGLQLLGQQMAGATAGGGIVSAILSIDLLEKGGNTLARTLDDLRVFSGG